MEARVGKLGGVPRHDGFQREHSGDRFQSPISEADPTAREVGEAIREFARGLGEMSMELTKSFGDVVKQSFGDEESFVMRKLGKPCGRVFEKPSFLNGGICLRIGISFILGV